MMQLVNTYVNKGHDMAEVQLVFREDNQAAAVSAFHKAMIQLGYKREDYGTVFARPTNPFKQYR